MEAGNPDGQNAGVHSVTWNEVPLVAADSQRIQQVQLVTYHSGKPAVMREFISNGEKYTLCNSSSDPVPPTLLKSHPWEFNQLTLCKANHL